MINENNILMLNQWDNMLNIRFILNNFYVRIYGNKTSSFQDVNYDNIINQPTCASSECNDFFF